MKSVLFPISSAMTGGTRAHSARWRDPVLGTSHTKIPYEGYNPY